MRLEMLIEWLEKQDPKMVVKDGFSTPHSDRGSYDGLNIEGHDLTRVFDISTAVYHHNYPVSSQGIAFNASGTSLLIVQYSGLAFRPEAEAKIEDMLEHAKAALGATFARHDGSEFQVRGDTPVCIGGHGECGEEITPTHFKYWLLTGATEQEQMKWRRQTGKKTGKKPAGAPTDKGDG